MNTTSMHNNILIDTLTCHLENMHVAKYMLAVSHQRKVVR